MVDDAIVVLENIVRHMEMGKPAMRAAFDGSAEIGFTILSMTLSLVAVFIPFCSWAGLLGGSSMSLPSRLRWPFWFPASLAHADADAVRAVPESLAARSQGPLGLLYNITEKLS